MPRLRTEFHFEKGQTLPCLQTKKPSPVHHGRRRKQNGSVPDLQD